MIVFDDWVAARLVGVARRLVGVVEGVGISRDRASGPVVEGFAGGYARAFAQVQGLERTDRGVLVAEFGRVVDQVGVARSRAAEVKRELEQARQHQSSGGGIIGPVGARGLRLRASGVPVVGSARVSTRDRSPRGWSDRSSAVPGDLERLSRTISTGAQDLGEVVRAFNDQVQAYSQRCAWSPIEVSSLVVGVGRYVDENREDSRWLAGIAQGFREAGSGSISTMGLAYRFGDLPGGHKTCGDVWGT